MPVPDFAVYVKGFAPYGNNVITMRGEMQLEEKIPFEATFFSFDPQLSKNVSAKILPEGIKILKKLGYSDNDAELLILGLQRKLLKGEVMQEVK
ncbi:MAG: hypothetical protein HYW25_01500 [Candidatus Aenigmarchaeota archaeon]|nr:hypothetical protein [Candidatus Aenigmarchaeota archaeon]